MMIRFATTALMFLLGLGLCYSQDTLNNETIIKMTKAGLAESLIVTTIESQPGQFSTKAMDLIALKEAGLTDKVIAAMLAKSSNGSPASRPIPSAASTVPETAAVREVGAYYKKAGAWVEMLPETVNWRTGGVLKNVGSLGVIKKDVNGFLTGTSSKTPVGGSVEVLIYSAEGVALTEYQLLKLRKHEDRREFRTVTGGVFNSRGGAMRDLIPFDGTKTAPRTFEIKLANLAPGEYGILPPGAIGSAGASSSLGKMYTFRIAD